MNRLSRSISAASIALVCLTANAYQLTDWENVGYAKGRWSVRCDDGRFADFIGLDGDGYYRGGGTADKNRDVVVRRILSQMTNCS